MRILISLGIFLLLGCSQTSAPLSQPPKQDPPTASGVWEDIAGPAGTLCADGSLWKFFVSRGDKDKLLVSFQGGGACWNDATCNPQSGAYSRNVSSLELLYGQGIYARNNAQNPFFGWTHVFVPYCTADLHWGNATVKYAATTINHKGAENSRAALDWIYSNFRPNQIMVTGCSAGAYGAAMWAPYLMQHYPSASVLELGDSGVGVVTDDFANNGFKNWKAEGAIPDFIPDLAFARQNASQMRLPDLYRAVAKAYPGNTWSEYTSNFDATQTGFFALMLGENPYSPSVATINLWNQKAISSLAAIRQGTPNFHSFVAPGSNHCIIPYPEFYTLKVGNQGFVDWVKTLVQTGNPGDVAP